MLWVHILFFSYGQAKHRSNQSDTLTFKAVTLKIPLEYCIAKEKLILYHMAKNLKVPIPTGTGRSFDTLPCVLHNKSYKSPLRRWENGGIILQMAKLHVRTSLFVPRVNEASLTWAPIVISNRIHLRRRWGLADNGHCLSNWQYSTAGPDERNPLTREARPILPVWIWY